MLNGLEKHILNQQRSRCGQPLANLLARGKATVIVMMCLLPICTQAAQDDEAQTVEFPVWARTWSGFIGKNSVEVRLDRIGDKLSGTYCYQPCTGDKRYRLILKGSLDDQSATLSERDAGAINTAERVTGTWKMATLNGDATGAWTSSDGKTVLPIKLSLPPTTKPFPYDIHLVADALPEQDAGCSSSPPHVSKIRLYENGRLAQELPTDSRGTCSIFLPSIVDANFDGWADLHIAQFLPAGPNIPYQTWLFDPKTRQFVDAPDGLQEVTSPVFDPVHKQVWTAWRASCCEHGVTTYRWHGKDLQEVQTASSYLLPVTDGGRRRYCYVTPAYVDGRIEYPDRVEQSDRSLTLTLTDMTSCDTSWGFPERTWIDVWKRDARSGALKLLRRENVRWQRTQTAKGMRYCPEVPFFANGKIQRLVLNDDPEQCSESDPAQPQP